MGRTLCESGEEGHHHIGWGGLDGITVEKRKPLAANCPVWAESFCFTTRLCHDGLSLKVWAPEAIVPGNHGQKPWAKILFSLLNLFCQVLCQSVKKAKTYNENTLGRKHGFLILKIRVYSEPITYCLCDLRQIICSLFWDFYP
jgi:hypothetical protein